MKKRPGTKILKRMIAMLLVCVIFVQSTPVYAQKTSQDIWLDFIKSDKTDELTEEMESAEAEGETDGETGGEMDGETGEETDGETEGETEEETGKETDEEIEDQLEDEIELEDDTKPREDIYENGRIKIYNLKQLYAIGTDQAVTDGDFLEDTFGTGEEIYDSEEEQENHAPSVDSETATSSNAFEGRFGRKSLKKRKLASSSDAEEGEKAIIYSLDADYELVNDIPMEPDFLWTLPEGFTGSFSREPREDAELYDGEGKQIPYIFTIITSFCLQPQKKLARSRSCQGMCCRSVWESASLFIRNRLPPPMQRRRQSRIILHTAGNTIMC